MNYINTFSRSIGFAGVICGGVLASLSLAPEKASGQTEPLNPCPSIYYEEPFNLNLVTPEYCPPNALTRLLQDEQPTAADEVQPFPEDEVSLPPVDSAPTTSIQPSDGMVDVQLNNTTNAGIYYQVTGETSRRLILPDEGMYLRNVPLPATITAVRADDGLLSIIPDSSDADTLMLSFDENPDFDDVQGVIRIQQDGEIFVY